jgi:uncharacterized repeat protein (TIGR01451 family)
LPIRFSDCSKPFTKFRSHCANAALVLMGPHIRCGAQKLAGRARAPVAVLLALACAMGAAPAQAQLRSLANPGFESNDPAGPGAPSYEIITNGSVIGWDATTGEIELWDSNFNGVPAHSGNVFAEMNANVNGTLFQNICLVNGEPIGWTFAHRARSGGPATQTARFQVATSGGTVIQTLATQASTVASNVWNVNSGSSTYTGPTGNQRVQFNTTDSGSFGNFLDSIHLTLRPFIQMSAANASGAESVASANIATLRVSGTVTTPVSVTVTVTGGTATLGSDFTTPGGGSSFVVTIPAGTYYDSAIPLGVTILDDSTLESNETINFSFSAGTGYTVGHTTSCGTTPQTTSTYTITDNDGRVTLRKQWANAAIGDQATVTLSRGAAVADTLLSGAGAANELDTDPTPTPVSFGETVTLSESLGTGNIGSYNGAVACTGAADTNLANGLTIGNGETAIVCTYTNTRRTATLTLRKTWVNAIIDNRVTVSTSGFTANDSFNSRANTANETDTDGSPLTVRSGETGTIAEVFTTGLASNYAAALACTGNSVPLAGTSLTIGGTDTAIVCTWTNTRTTTLAVTKTSSVVSDPVNGTPNAKAIPGATVRYCIAVANSGTATATAVTIADPLPAGTSYIAGSLRSGTSCAATNTVEDDDSNDSSEGDAVRANVTGTTVNATAATLLAGGSIALAFNVLVN